MKIFVITTINFKFSDRGIPVDSTRTVGWFPLFSDAEVEVVNNCCDIWEGSDDLVVIEEMEPGLYPTVLSERWYKYNRETEKYEPTDKPKEYERVVNFGIG